jgi:hypothetical protein
MPKVPEWEQIATAIYDRGEAAARGATAPSVALAQLDAKADELLEKRRWMLARQQAASPGPARAAAAIRTGSSVAPPQSVAAGEPADRSCVDIRPAPRVAAPRPAPLSGGAPPAPSSRGRTSLNPPPMMPRDLSGDLVCCDGDWLP